MRLLPLAVLLLAAGPALAQPAQLSADAIQKIKATTVYIKVRVANGMATGSGFLARKDEKFGWVVSNDHVLAPTTGKSKADRGQPMAVLGRELVFQSGTKDEWRVACKVVARDPERDLACVQFLIPKGVTLPEPMSPQGVRASETMPVYVCGFPFGGNLAEGEKNPEISIGPASVSSVRSDERGETKSVQINGALNPGNSGGPVVNGEGRLVGVAVTTIVGAGLGFAVPQQMVREMMAGRVSEPLLLRSGNETVAVALLVDPLNKVKVGKGWIAPVADLKKPVVPDVSALSGAKSFAYKPDATPTGLRLVYTPLNLGNLTEVWMQNAWEADGSPKKSVAHRTKLIVWSGGGMVRPGGGGGGDDDSPGELPPDFFDSVPGLPPAPAPPGGLGGPRGGPFAGPRGDAPAPGPGMVPRPFGGPGLRGPKLAPGGPLGGRNPRPPADLAPLVPKSPAPGGTDTGTPPPAEEEEVAPPSSAAPPPQPALTAPPDGVPVRPPAAAEEGISARVVVLAGGLMMAAVLGVVVVGAAVMYTGQQNKKPKRKRPSRDWDDEDEDDYDDRPRRRRR